MTRSLSLGSSKTFGYLIQCSHRRLAGRLSFEDISTHIELLGLLLHLLCRYALTNMELKNKALSEQVYIFNTFFYQRLLSKPA